MIMPIAIALFAFYTVWRGPLFDQFRAIDIVLLVPTGLCFA